MKKTLITLMALAGVACGANGDLTQIYDFQGIRNTNTGAGNLIENTADYDRTVFDMKDAPVYANITNTTITDILNGTDQNTCLTLAFWVNYNSAKGKQQMLFGWGENGTGIKFGIDNGAICGTTKDVASLTSGTVTNDEWSLIAVTYKSGTTTVDNVETPCLTMILRDVSDDKTYLYSNKTYNAPTTGGDVFSILSGSTKSHTEAYKGLLGGVGIFTSTGNVGDVTNAAIATAMGPAPVLIPEPATATLSLLALAGLAARRRRK